MMTTHTTTNYPDWCFDENGNLIPIEMVGHRIGNHGDTTYQAIHLVSRELGIGEAHLRRDYYTDLLRIGTVPCDGLGKFVRGELNLDVGLD